MNIFSKFVLFLGIAKFEAKRGAGQEVFEKILLQLPKPLEDTDDAQISHFKSVLLPLLSKDEIFYLKVYLKWMMDSYCPDGCLTGSEEQYFSKWEGIYRKYLEALPD